MTLRLFIALALAFSAPQKGVRRRPLYPAAGGAVAVTYENITNGADNGGGDFTATSAFAKADSVQTCAAGNCTFTFVLPDKAADIIVVGISTGSFGGEGDMEFRLKYWGDNGSLWAYAPSGSLGGTTWSAGDTFSIVVESGGNVKFYKGATLIDTETAPSLSYPYEAALMLNGSGERVADATLDDTAP